MPTKTSSLARQLRKRGPFACDQEEAYLSLLRSASLLEGPFHALFKSVGLTESSYNVLRILRGHHPDGLASQEIGPQMVVRVPDVTRLVDRLVDRGYACRQRDQDDRRVITVKATRAGLNLLGRLDDKVTELHRGQFNNLSERELKTLVRLLEKSRSDQDC